MNNYIPIIGLEIHVELKTKTGMFCRCKVGQFEDAPNTHVCPVCLGLPGALPVPNKKAIEWTVKIGQALNCTINKHTKFDRKHYSYPDLPKGYQISQYDEPIAVNGKLQITNSKSQTKEFRINRVHLEEDTGKLTHAGSDTLVDFNRSGTPLVEIVTEPDFRSSEDVKAFLEELHTIIRYLDVSDADLEKGTMRMEPNISVKEIRNPITEIRNEDLPKYKVEVKNINSFNFVKRAIDFEVERHMAILKTGKLPIQETRGWNSDKGITYSQRSKEEAHDYRYFPEPDIPPFEFTDDYLEHVRKTIPELPSLKMKRFISEYKIKERDAFILTRSNELSMFYEEINSKIKTQILKHQFKIENVGQVIANFIINKKISTTFSVPEFVKKAIELSKPVETDAKLLETVVQKIIQANPKVVTDYKSGKQNAIMFLVGQVMREMRGKAKADDVIVNLKKVLT